MWGKIIGGMAGFAMGGPFGLGPMGAVIGAAMGHAAETGGLGGGFHFGMPGFGPAAQARIGGRDQLFAMAVVVLSAKLAKCDGPVTRQEIDGFKRFFRVPPEAVRDIGRLFDNARDSSEGFAAYADQLGTAFADNRGVLEDVLSALFGIARADGPVNNREQAFLARVWQGFGLDQPAWDRASGAAPRRPPEQAGEDPYEVLGVPRDASPDALRTAWKQLMRDNHPDSLASRGVPQAFIDRASDKVARINAAWDRIKRERGL